MSNVERQRLEATQKEDRLTLVKILALNGYCTKLVTVKGTRAEGTKTTYYVEYWKEQ